MKASRRWWSAGIVVIAVVAVLLLSMALPTGVAARPVAGGAGASVAVSPAAPASSAPKASSAPAAVGPSTSGSPHPGTLDIYEVAPAGQSTEDPSVAYDTVSYEPIINVYQTLVAYNGSSSANFVPELSTCVPGDANGASSTPSVSCQAIYGNSLVTLNGGGQPVAFTYPIDSAAKFYDPQTGVSWPVYPSDVMFTISRTMGFAMLPSMYVLNGWIITQSLLPIGNHNWDGGIHYPLNNTPQNILGSMLVNDSAYCPAAALASNGCITFLATGEGTVWPFFNDFVGDALGAGVEPCGWYTAQSAGVPGFAGSTLPNGDGPCLLPGGSTNTSQSGFHNYLNTTSPKAWDSFESLALNHPAVQTGVQFDLVGSGPYYIPKGADQQTVGYTMYANPAYKQPTGCVGVGGGCQPAVGAYQGKVAVLYEPDDTQGIQEYIAGQADAATIQPPETAQMLQLAANGQIGYQVTKTLSIFFDPYNLAFNVTGEKVIDPTGSLNVPSTFFASNTVRNLLNHAWLYTTVLNTLWSIDGIQYGYNYGGAIPNGMGNYYPTNISWPYLAGDPGNNPSVVNSAAWWWAQGTNVSSPYYDAQLAACKNTTCKFPLIGELGAPTFDTAFQEWATSISTITGGAVAPYTFDLSFPQLVYYSGQAPYANPMPVFTLGWAPDYPDPTDYMGAMYYANATYTFADAVWQGLETTAAFNVSCGAHVGPTFANLSYWAEYLGTVGTPIPASCQGPAYNSMLYGMNTASALPVGNYRLLLYNLVEHIENQLGLYTWEQQATSVETYAPWINNATVNTNVMIGGGGDQTWYLWGYTNAVTTVSFQETGLATGTSWSVTYAGHLFSGTGATITVPNQANGTYPYQIGYVSGYTITTGATNGTVTVLVPTANTVSVAFTSFSGGATLGFQEIGLASGTNWTVVVQGVGAVTGSSTLVSYTLPSGSYAYGVGIQTGYQAPPAGTAATGTVVSLMFKGVLFSTFPVTVQSYGLSGASWTATLSTVPGPGVSATGFTNTSTSTSIVFWEPNGTFTLSVSSSTSLQPVVFSNTAVVAGLAQVMKVAWVSTGVPATFTVTFTETGATGAWSVSFNGVIQSSTGSSISFTSPNGTYTYFVSVAPAGQVASPSGGQVTVPGAAVSVPVTFGSAPTTQYNNATTVPTWAYAVIGVFVLLTLVFLATTLMARRRPPSPPSPQTWTPGGESKGGGGDSPPPGN